MRRVAERRRHHPLGGMIPLPVEIFAFVQREVLDQRFAEHPHSLLPRPANSLVRLLAGNVDDIDRNTRGIRDGDGPIGGLSLDFRRARKSVGLGTGKARRHEFLLKGGDEIAILGVDQGKRAQCGAALERRKHLVVIDHQGALVGHEMLERVDPSANHRRHLLKDLLRPAGDRHMERVVAASLPRGAFLPGVKCRKQTALVGQHEIDNECGAS